MSKGSSLMRSVALRGPTQPSPIKDLDGVLDSNLSVGEEIKELRRASDVTLAQLGEATGLSKGYLSQIERGISSPSIKSLHLISRALGVNISWFFNPGRDKENPIGRYVVRKAQRRSLKFESGITDELLSPNLSRQIELLRCTFAPHSHSGLESYEHKGEEAGYIVSGSLTLWLDNERISLEEGDSFAFESSIPHRYANETDHEALIIWVITPPSY